MSDLATVGGTRIHALDDRADDWYETALQLAGDGVYQLDLEGRFVAVNDVVLEVSGYDADELLGEHVSLLLNDESVRNTERLIQALFSDDRDGAVTHTATVRTKAGEELSVEFRMGLLREDGEVTGTMGVARDLTGRWERERRLRERANRIERERNELRAELDEVFSRVTDAVFALDERRRFTYVNERAAEHIGRDEAKLLGERVEDVLPDLVDGPCWPRFREAMETQEPVSFEAYSEALDTWFETHAYPSETGLSVYYRDVSDRKARERELQQYETIVETVGDGIYVLDADNRFTMTNGAFRSMTGYDRDELLGAHASEVFDELAVERADELQADLETCDSNIAKLGEQLSPATGDPFPVESRFAPFDGDGRAGVVRDVSERVERERTLEAQRERLATLNDVNGVIQAVSHAILDADSREEIERVVCERLAAADQFEFAWFGDVDAEKGAVQVRTEAGVDGGLGDLAGSMEPGTDCPAGLAARSGRVQTVDDAFADPDYEQWREHAREYGYRSSVAVPVTYEGVLYGVLNVYAAEPGVFEGDIECIVSRLGQVVGHAINALDSKRALVGDEITELEFRVPDVLTARGVDVEGGRVEFESMLPTGDGTYAAYGTASPDGVDTLRAMEQALPHYRELTVREGGEQARFALELREPPLASLVVSLGGRVARTVLEGDTIRMTVHLPYDADVRDFVENVRAEYDDAEVLAQRRATRSGAEVKAFGSVLDERLTDRQRVALEAAYVSGFFEWPRECTGEDVAESMSVSPATFHQHLREAERRIVTELFESLTR